jgi:alcohol dehydrogenase class IV
MAVITYLTRIVFDFGAVRQLPDELATLNIRRPLIVTDPGIASIGLLDNVKAVLPAQLEIAVYSDTPANPTEAATLAALEIYQANDCDGIIAIGGGSSLDLAKGVRLLATHPGPLAQYALVDGGVARIRADVAPLIAVPTTAGTGSEVGRGAVLIMQDGRKLGVISPHLIPNVAICDPELTLGLPPVLTAGTGMDAMAHCIETFLAPAVNPPAEAIALDGLGRASQYLLRAYRDGSDREARWNMMMASMEGAMAFQKGLGAVHSLSHPLGGLKNLKLHHGTLNAILLPAVLNFNRSHVGDKYQRMAQVMKLDADSDVADAIAELNRQLGLPPGLDALGVEETVLPEIARQALQDHCHATNPRTASEQDYLNILQTAMN